MTNFTFIRSPIQEIDESFREEGFTAVERLINSLNPPNISQPANPTLEPVVEDFEKTKRSNNFDILLDSGSGRISRGLNSLQSISRIISGKSSMGIKSLSNTIIYSNEREVRSATYSQLRTIVLRNLGIENLIEPARNENSNFVDNTLAIVDRIGKLVQRGEFSSSTYQKEMITRSRVLVNLSNTSTVKRENVI